MTAINHILMESIQTNVWNMKLISQDTKGHIITDKIAVSATVALRTEIDDITGVDAWSAFQIRWSYLQFKELLFIADTK